MGFHAYTSANSAFYKTLLRQRLIHNLLFCKYSYIKNTSFSYFREVLRGNFVPDHLPYLVSVNPVYLLDNWESFSPRKF